MERLSSTIICQVFLIIQLVNGQRDFNPFGNNQRDNNPFSQPPTRETILTNSFDQPQRPFNPFSDTARRPEFGVFNPNRDFADPTFVFTSQEEKKCPQDWRQFRENCYRFVRSPVHNRDDARRNCQVYGNGADLVSINSLEEHSWIVRSLLALDPQHRLWYVSARQSTPGTWVNSDGTQLSGLDQAFLHDQPTITYITQNFLAYSFSDRRKMWGLLKVTGQDVHQYICEVPLSQVPYIVVDDTRDFDYGLEVTDRKKIPRGPYFIQEPKSEVFDLSRNILRTYISLSCLAGGWPAPTYRWFKETYDNNRLVANPIEPLLNPKYTVSGGSLIIDKPSQTEDRGNYHCVASNIYGSIISETVSLSFGYIGEFILSRSPEYGNQYWGKAIYCDPPQHFPGIHYYWSRKYFPNLVEEDQRVFVSYDGHLYISAVDMSDQGNYSCNVQSTVSNSGRNGPLFSLQVVPNANYQQLKFPNNFPKVFPEAPSAGGEVRLECVAFGYPVPSYNWTRRDSSLPRSAILSNYNRVLTIPNVTVEDIGDYVCRASNSKLSTESTVTLSIQAAPTFTIPLENRHMDKNANLVWTCEAFGIPDVGYQWYRNGILLSMDTIPSEDAGRYSIQDNVLRIVDLDEERDNGMYQCRGNNSLAARFSSAQLRVLLMRPQFLKRPLDKEILAAEGGNVTIKCEPEAAPAPRFTWRKDGNVIGSGGRRRILSNGNLLINPVSREDQGIFTCIAQNSRGIDESSGRLTVLRGPVFLDPPPDRLMHVMGSHLSLRCRADADVSLDIAYIWKQNGMRLNESDFRIHMNSQVGSLEIYNLTISDRGDYECEVQTWVGKLRSITRVDIIGPPGVPGGVVAFDLTSTNATIRWTDGASNGKEAFLYTIQGRTQWDPIWRTLGENIDAERLQPSLAVGTTRLGEVGRKETKLMGVLSPWSAYEFRVSAANEFGYGPFSAPSPQYNTLPNRPTAIPRNVTGGGGKTGSLTITWLPLPTKDQNAPGIHYKIFWRRYKEEAEDEFQTLILKKWGNIGSHVVSIPSQYYFTWYQVKVQALNDIGPGPESPPVVVYTAEDMPQAAPSLVIPKPFNSTAINVTWTAVEETREKIRGELIGYRIRYWLKKDTNLYDPEALNLLSRSKDSNALIVGLIPNTYYYVQVMAYNSAGPGPASEPQFERTLKKAPQKPPTAVSVLAIDPYSIRVTWRYVAPSIEEEALSGYKVRVWEADQDISKARDSFVRIGSKLEATIGGLTPGKLYILRVLAYSAGGDGKMSSPAQEFVLGDPEQLKSSRASPALGHISIYAAFATAVLQVLMFIPVIRFY